MGCLICKRGPIPGLNPTPNDVFLKRVGFFFYSLAVRKMGGSLRDGDGLLTGTPFRRMYSGGLSLPTKTSLTVQPVFFISALSRASIRESSLCFMLQRLGR
jgi:hypothetical protein